MLYIMNKRRDYQSPLRQEQTKRTRELILEGLIQTMAHGGLADLSIPAVARVAGVSLPTIYRHFRTKRELIASLGSYILQKFGLIHASPPPPNPQNRRRRDQGPILQHEGTHRNQ